MRCYGNYVTMATDVIENVTIQFMIPKKPIYQFSARKKCVVAMRYYVLLW